ncbi:hypothetical protein RB594_006062 [Gaeumannomyces avenae]
MDAGASILAFLTAGLQSAKLAYDLVSAIKDGPQRIRDLKSALGHLVTLLGYLEADPSLVPQKDAAIIQKCRDNLNQIKIDVEKLCISDEDGMLRRMWKKMKPALREKDIAQILAKVTAQTATIGVYAIVAKSITVNEIHTRQSEFHKENRAALGKQSTDIFGIASHQVTIHGTVMGNERLLADIAACQTTTRAALRQQQASLAESALRQGRAESRAILDKLSAVASKAPTPSSYEDATAQAELQASIATLKMLVDKKSHLVSGEKSDSIRQAITSILQFLIREAKAESYDPDASYQTRAEDATQILEQIKFHFEKQPQGHLALDTLTRLNPASMRAPSLIGENRVCESSTAMELHTQQADLYIKRSRFTSTSHKIHDEQDQQRERQVGHHHTEVRSEIAIRSRYNESTGGFILKASVVEALNYCSGARAVLAPMVAVHRIVSSYSDVFQSIRDGRLDKLISLISDGKASLKDRDESGASLLHYACAVNSADICKFLLEHGADPNDEANTKEIYWMLKTSRPVPIVPTPLGTIWASHFTTAPSGGAPAFCAKYLVEHGAEVGSDALLAYVIKFPFNSNLLQAFLCAASSTIDISRHRIGGHSLISIAFRVYASRFSTVRTLVEAGASVNGLFSDEPPPLVVTIIKNQILGGQKCCRHIFCQDAVQTIKYLMAKGADVHATWQGRSCTAIAYGEDGDTSSYNGDVWDAALASTGHDVEQFRRQEQQPHSPRFWASLHPHPEGGALQSSYRLADFRDMWEGMEHLCPYYDQVMSAGEGEITIIGEDCFISWCPGRSAKGEELEDSSSEWETESEE